MKRYIRSRTCVYNITYHIVWCVRYRKKVLNKEISEYLPKLIRTIANKKEFLVLDCYVENNDSVHCFVSVPPKLSVTQVVKYLKGISGNNLLRKYPDIKKSLWHGQLWNGSYFCESLGTLSEEDVDRYVERQKNCQL